MLQRQNVPALKHLDIKSLGHQNGDNKKLMKHVKIAVLQTAKKTLQNKIYFGEKNFYSGAFL